MQGGYFTPFYQWGNSGSTCLSNLPGVAQQVRDIKTYSPLSILESNPRYLQVCSQLYITSMIILILREPALKN